MNSQDYDEWSELECNYTGLKNHEIVEKFINKYFKWISSKKRTVGNETRELVFKDYTGVARNKIKMLIFEMSS
tara:strand:- start:4627 stop:4845 length:219 start_codon:yes stop_codon:yes gene_type:complete